MRAIYSFVGMSGVGKSHWSKKLAELGYDIYSIDDLIAQKLQKLIKKFSITNDINYSKSNVGDLAKWMGFPDDERYKQNSKKYLEMESKVVQSVLNKALKSKKNTIIDTTGSVIYINKNVLKALKKSTNVVYFDSPASHLKSMFEEFKRNPKPIIWGNIYKPLRGEKEEKALLRCYKELIDFRIKHYERLADITIPYKWQYDRKRKVAEIEKKILKNI